MLEVTLDSRLTPDQRDCVETSKKSAEYLLSLLNELLDFSKIEAGRLDLEHSPFSLRECVRDAKRTLAAKAAEKGLELRCEYDDGVPDGLNGDPVRVRQIVLNLLGNAIKFTHNGYVSVRVRGTPAKIDAFDAVDLTIPFPIPASAYPKTSRS
jgi:signal transduction histidine kinase